MINLWFKIHHDAIIRKFLWYLHKQNGNIESYICSQMIFNTSLRSFDEESHTHLSPSHTYLPTDKYLHTHPHTNAYTYIHSHTYTLIYNNEHICIYIHIHTCFSTGSSKKTRHPYANTHKKIMGNLIIFKDHICLHIHSTIIAKSI